MIRFGYAKEDITPRRGIPLCGYFTPRPNVGMHDPLQVKAAVFECNGVKTGIVSFDLCEVDRSVYTRFITALKAVGISYADDILFAATHTHTGPYVCDLFGDDPVDDNYMTELTAKVVSAVGKADMSLAEAELLVGRSECTTLAFNRRFWMKDGGVLTNPGKRNPNIVKPEGGIDAEIPFAVVKQDGLTRLIIANISNHTDTIGDEMVSADWPGRMEREVQNRLGYDVQVMTLIAPQGNINHFNVETDFDQTNYAEACRIGKGYAEALLSMLYTAKPADVDEIKVFSEEFEAPAYKVTDAEYAESKKILDEIGEVSVQDAKDNTSEGIAAGNLFVKKFFAQRVVDNRDKPMPGKRIERMTSIHFGKALGIVSMPAEPFVELGFAVKKASPFPFTMVAALGQGAFGYIGLPEHYEHGGGYETRPSPTAPDHNLAPKMIEIGIRLINK